MEVFLFPLVNTNLFPGTTKPFNVFEPRYVAMIKESIAQNKPIAVAYIEELSAVSAVQVGDRVPFVKEVAGYGYAQILEERLNGSLLIFIRGLGKVRLGEVKASNSPYLVCETEVIYENKYLSSLSQRNLESLMRFLTRWVNMNIPDSQQRQVFLSNVTQPEEILGCFAAFMVRDPDFQQIILECDDLNQKVNLLHRLFESNELTG